VAGAPRGVWELSTQEGWRVGIDLGCGHCMGSWSGWSVWRATPTPAVSVCGTYRFSGCVRGRRGVCATGARYDGPSSLLWGFFSARPAARVVWPGLVAGGAGSGAADRPHCNKGPPVWVVQGKSVGLFGRRSQVRCWEVWGGGRCFVCPAANTVSRFGQASVTFSVHVLLVCGLCGVLFWDRCAPSVADTPRGPSTRCVFGIFCAVAFFDTLRK
jgi:hypothetical protein